MTTPRQNHAVLGRILTAVALLAALLPLAPRIEWAEVVQTRLGRVDHLPDATGAYTSPPLELGVDATSLGAHWDQSRAPDGGGVALALRASPDGLAWSDWYPLEGDAIVPADEGERVLGQLALGLGGRYAQYRAAPAPGATVLGVTLFGLDSSGRRVVPRPSFGPRIAAATIKPLGIVSRQQWGADESIRFATSAEGLGAKIWPEEVARVEKIVVHHTAGPNVCSSHEAWCQRRSVTAINDIYQYHTLANGWGDIGYNSIVGYDGRIYEGRHAPEPVGATEPIDQPIVGAHALGYNARSHGISLMGNFELEPVPDGQWDALSRMVGWIVRSQLAAAPLDPTGRGDFSGSGRRFRAALPTIVGHRDLAEGYATECPGEYLYARLETLREQVRRLVEWPPLRVELRARPLERGEVAYHVFVDNHEPELVKGLIVKGAVPENADFVDSWAGAPTQNRGKWDGSTVTWYAPDEALDPGRERREHVFVVRPKSGVAPAVVRAVAWVEFAEPARGVAMSEHVAADAPVDLLVDPAVADRASWTGDWSVSRNVAGYYGDAYQLHGPGDGQAVYAWETRLPRAGTYEVLAWWTSSDDRATNAPFTIWARGGARRVEVDQRKDGSRWVPLGQFELDAGPVRVTLADASGGVVIADAVRFRQVP